MLPRVFHLPKQSVIVTLIYWCNTWMWTGKMNTKGPWRCFLRLEERERRMCPCVHIYLRDPALPECKRWITMETDCHWGNGVIMMCEVSAVLRSGPPAIRYSSMLHCITWPITYIVCQQVIYYSRAACCFTEFETSGRLCCVFLDYVLSIWHIQPIPVYFESQ